MSVTVSLAELADMAFGTADGGTPRVGTLRVLLRGLLEHLHSQEATAQVGEDARGLLELAASAMGGKPCSLHQQPWLGRTEGRQSHPSMSPGTTELPTPGLAAAKEWQMVQLKKRMEVTKEWMTKVMDMLQEMLTTVCSLKTTVEGFQEELQLLEDNFQKAGLEEVQERSVWQDEHSHLLQTVLDQLKLSDQEVSPKTSQGLAHEASCRLSCLLEQHETSGTHVSHHESQLQQHANLGTLADVDAQLEKKPGEMRHQQDGGEKGLDFSREVLGQVGQLQEQCMRLRETAERLWGDTKDTQKADKAAPETKASQEELQHAMVQLSKLMQDLLQRMSLLEQDRKKTLENLLSEMDSKAWCPNKPLCQGPCCGANHAAGFKRQLSDPARCISCDRPLATGPVPHLVTTRKTSQLLQIQPAGTSGSTCLPQRRLQRESKGSSRASRGPASPTGPLSTSSSLITVCPCGEPADFICKSREVDILGINGVIYKGRLNSPAANRTGTVGTDFPATKTPQPCSQHTAKKMHGIPKHGSYYVSPYSCAAMQMETGSSGGQWQAAMGRSRTASV